MAKVPTSIFLDKGLLQQLDRVARRAGHRSRSAYIASVLQAEVATAPVTALELAEDRAILSFRSDSRRTA